MGSTIEKFSEFFLLRDLETRARAVPADERSTVSRAHARARQRRDAAEALWIAGFPSEALRLLNDALSILGAPPGPDEVPELDEDVKPEHAERYRALLAEIEQRMEQGRAAALDVPEIGRTRVRRIALAAVAGLGAVALLVTVLRTPKVLKAEASASYDQQQFEPSRAVDGSDKTEWLLPDRAAGWIEVSVQPARKLRTLKLMNARNLPYADRATNEFHVDVYDKGQVVKQLDGKFEAFSAEPTWRTLDLGLHVEKIRVSVKSWHHQGGGFAEIQVE